MFKKDISQSTLYDKVEKRISNILTTQINYIKQKAFRFFSFVGIPSFIFTIMSLILFCKTTSPQDLYYSCFLSIGAFVTIITAGLYLEVLFHLKFIKTSSHYNSFVSTLHKFIKPDNNIILNEHLTEEEINELFSLPLEKNQISFLQDQIINHNYISLNDLSQLILIKEEQEKKLIMKQQEKLYQFFLENNLSKHPHSELIKTDLTDNEIEYHLTSRL